MLVVFVHGVNTRKTKPSYAVRLGLIDRFVQKHLAGATLGGAAVTSLSLALPYWGDLPTVFAGNMASRPTGHINALGPAIDDRLRPLIAARDDDLERHERESAIADDAGHRKIAAARCRRHLGSAPAQTGRRQSGRM